MSSGAVLMATKPDESGSRDVSLVSLGVHAEICDLVTEVTLTQVYENDRAVPIEATYCFPVEEGAAVHGFRIETGGRTLTGVVEDRDQAFDVYDSAIAAGNAAYLLDQETEDILTVSVGNIEPGQQVKVVLSYVSELVVYDGTARFQLPTTVSPRYALPGTSPEDADRISPPVSADVPYTMELEVVVGRQWAQSVTSPSHPVESREDGERLVVTPVGGSIVPDQDFVLEITMANRGVPVCLVGTDDSGNTAGVVRFYPDVDTPRSSLKSEVLFAIDCSGSMDGSSIEEAKHALELCLRSLQKDDLFNIIRFGSTYELYRPESVRYQTSSFNKAVKAVRKIRADLGGTELQEAMTYACGLPAREGYQRDIVLITDGEVSDPDSVIRLVAGARDRQRVFSFGIGYGASGHLVSGVARQSNGAYEMIQPGELVQPKVLRQMSRMVPPVLSGLALQFRDIDGVPPSSLRPVFDGDSWTTYFSVPGNGERGPNPTVTLTAGKRGSELTMEAPVVDVGPNNAISPLWALSEIRELKYASPAGSGQGSRRAERNKQRIIEVAKRHNVLSDYTSFVAVQTREDGKRNSGTPEFQRVPVLLTRDWHGASQLLEPAAMPASGGSADLMLGAVPSAPAGSSGRSIFGGAGMPAPRSASKRSSGRRSNRMDAPQPTAHAEESVPWYLDVLSTQHPEGYFEGVAIVARLLEIPEPGIRKLAVAVSVGGSGRKLDVLVTWLSVNMLRADAEAITSSLRAVKKAEKWLLDTGCDADSETGLPIVPMSGDSLESLIAADWPGAAARLGIGEA